MKTGNLTIKDGNLTDNGLLKATLDLKDGEYEWYIGKASEMRSGKQNRYWWLCMEIMGKEIGYKKKAMSTEIKKHFHWYETHTNKKTGEVEKDFESSRDWSKKEFSDNIDQLILLAADYGITLPDPKEYFNENT